MAAKAKQTPAKTHRDEASAIEQMAISAWRERGWKQVRVSLMPRSGEAPSVLHNCLRISPSTSDGVG